MHDSTENPDTLPQPSAQRAVLVLAYVVIVLLVDLLATWKVHFLIDWTWFNWHPNRLMRYYAETGAPVPGIVGLILNSPLRGFDGFKLLFWFCIPFCICFRSMDWPQFSFRGWKRIDYALLGGGLLIGALAILLVALLPQLKAYYPSLAHLTLAQKQGTFFNLLIWNLCWLPGWEFLFRYFLLRPINATWPRFGWLWLPLLEGAYHLQKAPLEALGMLLFSIAATQWVLRRNNLLLPLLIHAAIEMGLIVFLLAV
ncbi:MAG: CPBP family intramembrane metalloprotease [Candidatus Hydrogenedentes bacterium]|nr:CPBP family intramembrane metalloprotease [Candidatus Hydrogenedentota bacterium]